MADSSITVIDIDSNQPKKVKIPNNGYGTDSYSYAETKGGFVGAQTGLTAGSLNPDLVPSTLIAPNGWFSLQILGTFAGTLTVLTCSVKTGHPFVMVLMGLTCLMLTPVDQTLSIRANHEFCIKYYQCRIGSRRKAQSF